MLCNKCGLKKEVCTCEKTQSVSDKRGCAGSVLPGLTVEQTCYFQGMLCLPFVSLTHMAWDDLKTMNRMTLAAQKKPNG